MLSHPAELAEAEDGVTSQAVIFVIDEFDMFATHPRQTLLYNLFDIAQSRKAPIAVLGCTTRMDVVEMLEKRVKSRFSHRYVYLSLPQSLPAFWNVCRQGLAIDEEDMEAEGIDAGLEGHEAFQANWNNMIEVCTSPSPRNRRRNSPDPRYCKRRSHSLNFFGITTSRRNRFRRSCRNAFFRCHRYRRPRWTLSYQQARTQPSP